MNLLIPKLSPIQWFLYSAALLVCWVFRGGSEAEVLYAIDPVTAAIAIGAGVKGAIAIGKGIANRRARKKAEKAAEAKDKRVAEALGDKTLGLTPAQMNELNLQNQMAGISAFKTQRENLKRQKAAGTISTADYNQQIAGLNKAVQDSTAAGRKDVQTLAGDLRTERQMALAAAADDRFKSDLAGIQMRLANQKEFLGGIGDAAGFATKGVTQQRLGEQRFERQKELAKLGGRNRDTTYQDKFEEKP